MASSRHVEVIPNSKRELDSQGDESDEKRRPLLLDSVDSGDDPDAPSSARLEPSGGVAPSPKKSRSNSTIPISKQINPSFGYAAIRSRLRSVLHHPYGLPLAWFLNKENEPCSGATREVSDKVDTAEHQRGWGDGGDGAGEGGSEARDQIGEAFGFATGPTPRTSENDSVISPSLLGNDTSQEQKIMATKTTFPRKEGDDLDMKAPGELSGDSHVEPLAKKESPHGKRDGNHVAENARDASTEAAAAEAIEYGDLEREAPIKTDIDYEVTLRKHFAPLVSALEATGNDKDLNGTEEVLARSFPAGLVPAEKDITKGLVSQMRSIVTKLGLEVKHEPRILNARVETPPYGKPDIVLVRSDCNSGTDTVMLLEVGLNNVHWWSKVHQGVMYLGDMLNCEQKKGIRFSGPALFAVLTIEPTESKEFNSGRLGVFLVTPKTTPSAEGDVKDFRVCLLSRFETSQETIGASTPAERQVELSRVFGRLLRASCKLPALDAASIDFEYLGPNCSRIGDKVRSRAPKLRDRARPRPFFDH